MNYLAHLFLAEENTPSIIGNLFADFTRDDITTIENIHGREIASGVKKHRQIDSFTDRHPQYKKCKNLLFNKHRHFSGIIIDVAFDYFLSKHWEKYTNSNIDNFIEGIHLSLTDKNATLPPNLASFIPYLIDLDILKSYSTLNGIQTALNRIDSRLSRKTSLGEALLDIQHNYKELEQNFLIFFPQLCVKFKHSLL